MNWLSSLPDWDGIHPAMVHFPIALLIAAPLLVLVNLFARRTWSTWAASALVVMALGALAAWLTAASGHAAGQLVDKTPELQRAIARHEALGVATRNLFTMLTVLFALLLLIPSLLKRSLPGALRIGIHAGFFVIYLGSLSVLGNTANEGGRLVHESGVRAVIAARAIEERPATQPATATAPAPEPGRQEPKP